jgi:hypothetical protein
LTADVCEGISFVMHESLEKWFGLVYGVWRHFQQKGYAINKRNTDNRMARHKMTNNDLWNTTRNTKDWTPADVCEGISFVMHESLEKWFGLVYGVWRHFQQYFSYIVAVSFLEIITLLLQNGCS